MNNRSIKFIKDKFNKYSIKALLASIEYFLPELTVEVIPLKKAKCLSGSLIFYSFNTLSLKQVTEIADQVRLNDDESVQVCGGSHPSAKPDDMLVHFDAVCVGEGEHIVIDIIRQYLSNEKISGIYRSEKPVELDDFGPFSLKNRIFGPIELTRGCKFKCAYCQVPELYGHELRHRSLENVFEMVKLSIKNEKFDIRFITPDATSYHYDKGVNVNAIEALLSGVRQILGKRGRLFFGSFPSEINPYYINEDIVRMMRDYCDNHTVVIGLQSASPYMLKRLGRPSDIEVVENSIELLKRYGFNVDVDFILGMPGENEISITDNMAWMTKWKQDVRIHAHYFIPLPSTRWETEKPLDIPAYYVSFLRSLEGKSQIYGHWQSQKKQVLSVS